MRPQLMRAGLTVLAAGLVSAVLTTTVLAQDGSIDPTKLPGSTVPTTGSPQTTVSGTATGEPTLSRGEFLLVIDSSLTDGVLNERLTEAGFNELSRIDRIPPRFSDYRLIDVESANAETKADLLEIDGIQTVRPVHRQGVDNDPILPVGQVIVKFDPATTNGEVAARAAAHGMAINRAMRMPGTYVLDVLDESTTDVFDAAEAIGVEAGVIYSHASVLFKAERLQAAGNPLDEVFDPLFVWQWHLHNTGQLENGVADADVDAPEAWQFTLGEGAIVGVVDDAMDIAHEDLAPNYLTGIDTVDDDDDPSPAIGPIPFDPRGDSHGTSVTGLICAAANDVGVRGVAPAAQFIGARVGFGVLGLDQDFADAILFCEENGAMAINNSWGAGGPPFIRGIFNSDLALFDLGVIGDAISFVATEGRDGLGVLVLFASGNDDLDLRNGNFYAAHPRVMPVGATLRDDRRSCYSNFGPSLSVTAPGSGVDFQFDCYDSSMATTDVTFYESDSIDPLTGEPLPIIGQNPPMMWRSDIDTGFFPTLVPDPFTDDLTEPFYTRHFNGTSAACPVATGVAALVFASDPGLSAVEARNIIEHTADTPDTEGPFDAVTGHNNNLGHGRVNALNALSAVFNQARWPSPAEEILADELPQTVLLSWEMPDWDMDGLPDADVAGALVVQGKRGQLNWSPTDGEVYFVGDEVEPGVFVVANDFIENLVLENVPSGDLDYAVFLRNDLDFYSWGRRFPLSGTPTDPGDLEPPPGAAASIRATPSIGPAPLEVQFTGGGAAPDGSQLVLFNWNFGDGTTATGPLVTHTYNTAGNYIAQLTAVSDSAQTARATVQITVRSGVNEAPTAEITATPNNGPVPLIVDFQANASDPDGSIVSYEWDFGDGSTGNGANIEHVYLDSGLFVALLTVTDDDGAKGQAVQVISVSLPSAAAGAAVPDLLEQPLPSCGTGATGAMAVSLTIMLGFTCLRRRR